MLRVAGQGVYLAILRSEPRAADSTDDEPFDWLFKWEHFAAAGFTKFIPPASKVLMLGCGNADFSADMYDSGITTNITNIDLSSVVINKMRKANLSRVGMTYHIMDVQDLEFADGCFDVVIDKSTMDCIFCCTDSTDIVCRMMEQAYRVLKPGGTYICMSLHDDEKVRARSLPRPKQLRHCTRLPGQRTEQCWSGGRIRCSPT